MIPVEETETRARETEPGSGPGRQLGDARRSAGLSVEDVSSRLHLDGKTVRALEEDAYAGLPAPTFVRGYLRGYARLLNLPPEPVVEAYNRQGFSPPALVPDLSEKPQARSTDFPVRLFTYLVVTGLIVLVVLWWQNQRFNPLEPAATGQDAPLAEAGGPVSGEQAAALGAVEAPAVVEREAAGVTPGPVWQSAAGGPAGQSPPQTSGSPAAIQRAQTAESGPPDSIQSPAPGAASAPDADSARETATPDAAAVEGTGDDQQAEPPVVAALDDAGVEAGDVSVSAIASGEEPAAAGDPDPGVETGPRASTAEAAGDAGVGAVSGDRLVMQFTGESWVEVYDRNDEKLYFNLVSGGGEVEVAGTGPFRVLLGRAEDVSVEFNGEPFDYGPYVERGIARFTLGGRPSAQATQRGPVDDPGEFQAPEPATGSAPQDESVPGAAPGDEPAPVLDPGDSGSTGSTLPEEDPDTARR